MKLQLSIRQSYRSADLVLKRAAIQKAITTALRHIGISDDCAIGIACVDEAQSQQLNAEYRHKNKPTNVLSFAADIPAEIIPLLAERPLGDLVICVPVVLQEAAVQNKDPTAHFYHLIVHGVLHLLGYDHELGDTEAAEMEALEIAILQKLGISNPYDME